MKQTRAERNIAWIETHCFVPEGKHAGKPFILTPHQRADMVAIYDNPHGTRTVIISYARKNAKTTFAACLVLLHLVGPEARRNGQLYSAARSRDQAAVLFKLAMQIVEMSPTLARYVRVRGNLKELSCQQLGTEYKALSAEAKTKYGLSPALVVHDELGQVDGAQDDLFDALETACGAQEEPLSIIISTQAASDLALLSVLIDDAKTGADPHTVLRLYTCPTEDECEEQGIPPIDPFSEEALRLANPGYGVILNEQELRKQADDARRMPSKMPGYRNLVLNQRVELTAPFIDMGTWRLLGGKPSPTRVMYMGLDLSSVNDLTSCTWLAEDATNGIVLGSHSWMPVGVSDCFRRLQDRARQDKVPYDVWVEQGHITAIQSESVDYDILVPHIMALYDRLKPHAVGFDRWNFKHFERALRKWCKASKRNADAILKKFVPVGMGTATMSPALHDFEGLILDRKLGHDDNPVLTWCMSNARVRGVADRRLLVKKNQRSRIDAAIAAAICLSVRATNPLPNAGNIGIL